MNNDKLNIDSGLLELFVLGLTNEEETALVVAAISNNANIANEIESITNSLLHIDSLAIPEPNPTVKTITLATIDFSERLKGGETPGNPPILNSNSKIIDYIEWLNRPDFQAPQAFDDAFAKIINYTPQCLSLLVWLKTYAPHEVHDNEYERFLIVEGSCEITFNNKVHSLNPGDYLQIPLHTEHVLKVTSAIPCKVVLQRVAA